MGINQQVEKLRGGGGGVVLEPYWQFQAYEAAVTKREQEDPRMFSSEEAAAGSRGAREMPIRCYFLHCGAVCCAPISNQIISYTRESLEK